MVTRYPAGSCEINTVNYPTSFSFAFLCRVLPVLSCLSLGFSVGGLHGLGYPGSIAASYGSLEHVCAIEANGEQGVLCWGKNSSLSVYPTSTPLAFSLLSGGDEFICGLKAGTGSPYCWLGSWSNTTHVPEQFWNFSYSTIAAGDSHVCAIRSLSNDPDSGKVDCWGWEDDDHDDDGGGFVPPSSLPSLSSLVAGRDFTCGLDKYSHFPHCWGSTQSNVLKSTPSEPLESLSAGTHHACGIAKGSKRAKCWGDNSRNQAAPPPNITFASVTTGMYHSCGITDSTHEVICWGDGGFDTSALPSGVSFLALTSAPNMTCGIREDSLLAMCWGNDAAVKNYSPPLQLFSPGVCSSAPCAEGAFSFNASAIMDLATISTSDICSDPSDQICAPCAWACPSGTYLSGLCSRESDRSCADCSVCPVSDPCRASCRDSAPAFPVASPLQSKNTSSGRPGGAAPIIGAAVTGGVVVAALGAFVLCFVYRKRFRQQFSGCASWRSKLSDGGGGGSVGGGMPSGIAGGSATPGGRRGGGGGGLVSHDVVRMQAFRLAVLRDATNGFKELNELGRGSYGFVYKALLPDGRQVAVKRANAARRIQCRSRDFEAELEVLCKVHHAHLVNLVGYCEEMGERLLVYEFMPHGTLHDHLHGGLAQLNWHLRLKVAAQAARGIEYLHKDASPRIIHRDIKSSNVLLDGEWGARVADFGLSLPEERGGGTAPAAAGGTPLNGAAVSALKPFDAAYVDPEYLVSQTYTEKSDVYSFGVVLLEILCGRKAYDSDFRPPNIVEWAIPYIRQGQSIRILDRGLDLPKNVEPLMRVAEIVELCVRPSPQERPSMSDVAAWLELVGRSSSL